MTRRKRTSLSKSIRCEVFKRDSFTCQYCGAKAPEVLIEVDHIHPVATGGTNDILNLVTACKACNAGKGPRLLDDHTVATKRRKQVEELQERRELIEMIMEWHRGLNAVKNAEAHAACEYLRDILASFGMPLRDGDVERVAKIVRSVGLQDYLQACDIAFAQYYDPAEALAKLSGIADNRKRAKTDPDVDGTSYLFGIARRRFGAFQNWQLKTLVRVLREAGVEWPWIHATAKHCDSYAAFSELCDGHLSARRKDVG